MSRVVQRDIDDLHRRYRQVHNHLLDCFDTEKIHLYAYESECLQLMWNTRRSDNGINGRELLNRVLNTQRQWLQQEQESRTTEELIGALNYFVTEALTHCKTHESCIVKPDELHKRITGLKDLQWFHTCWVACTHEPTLLKGRSAIAEAMLLSELLRYLDRYSLKFLGVLQIEKSPGMYVFRDKQDVDEILRGNLDFPQPSPELSPVNSQSASSPIPSAVSVQTSEEDEEYNDSLADDSSPSPGTPPTPCSGSSEAENGWWSSSSSPGTLSRNSLADDSSPSPGTPPTPCPDAAVPEAENGWWSSSSSPHPTSHSPPVGKNKRRRPEDPVHYIDVDSLVLLSPPGDDVLLSSSEHPAGVKAEGPVASIFAKRGDL